MRIERRNHVGNRTVAQQPGSVRLGFSIQHTRTYLVACPQAEVQVLVWGPGRAWTGTAQGAVATGSAGGNAGYALAVVACARRA